MTDLLGKFVKVNNDCSMTERRCGWDPDMSKMIGKIYIVSNIDIYHKTANLGHTFFNWAMEDLTVVPKAKININMQSNLKDILIDPQYLDL